MMASDDEADRCHISSTHERRARGHANETVVTMVNEAMTGVCALCGREEQLTRHHLIPRTRHRNRRNKRDFDRAEVRETVGLCRPCHSQLHRLFTEKELEREWNTLEKLREHPDVAAFVRWIATKPPGFRASSRNARRRA